MISISEIPMPAHEIAVSEQNNRISLVTTDNFIIAPDTQMQSRTRIWFSSDFELLKLCLDKRLREGGRERKWAISFILNISIETSIESVSPNPNPCYSNFDLWIQCSSTLSIVIRFRALVFGTLLGNLVQQPIHTIHTSLSFAINGKTIEHLALERPRKKPHVYICIVR